MIKSISIVLLMLLIFSCDSDLEGMNQEFKITGEIPDAYYTNFNITYSDSGKLKVKITGITLEQHLKTKEIPGKDIMKDSVHVRFYNDFRQKTSELKADHAIRHHDTEMMYAKGNVIVVNSKGERLNSERLTWDSKAKKIICDTTVVITKPGGLKIIGSSLESDEKFENYTIKKIKDSKITFDREEAPE
tara:strand:+ start:283 stop:849 length:567 start_codon:yes stop_codon:yes gene_type:complete